MAEIVAGFGMPHTPNFPALVAREGPQCEVARLYAEIAEHVAAVAPDVLIIFTDDHFNTFFLDNFPTFAVGIAETTSGPNDQTPMPHYKVAVPAALAAHIRATAIARGFDISLVQDFEVDHATMVPLHFLTPHMKIPVVPIFINGLAPPLPGARRCYALGEAVRAAVEAWPQPLRVAVIGSGSFSLEIGGPKIPPGERAGTPDPEWTAARAGPDAAGPHRRPDRRGDHRAHAAGRQYRRRTAQLDRHARRHRRAQAARHGAAERPRPRLRRLALELSRTG